MSRKKAFASVCILKMSRNNEIHNLLLINTSNNEISYDDIYFLHHIFLVIAQDQEQEQPYGKHFSPITNNTFYIQVFKSL